MALTRDFSDPAVRRGWVGQLRGPLDETLFEARARELFAWQFARVPAFRRLCEGHGVSPKRLNSWREIPAVPQQLFKRAKLFAHGKARAAAIYETSGTTTGAPGRQHLLRTDIYEAMSVEGARQVGLFDQEADWQFLTPSPKENARSSLSAMFGHWRKAAAQKNGCFRVRADRFDLDGLRAALEASVREKRPAALCGTAFSFVHLLDAWKTPLRLPRGSWLLETGGFKGRTREVPKAELYRDLGQMFHLQDGSLWNEYGMSELSSQAYARGTSGLHRTPPWTRVLVGDPATGREVRVGREGLVRWIDLANVDSVLTLQTLDRAERQADGFRLIGRLARTEPRGCSLGAEDLMSPAGAASKRKQP